MPDPRNLERAITPSEQIERSAEVLKALGISEIAGIWRSGYQPPNLYDEDNLGLLIRLVRGKHPIMAVHGSWPKFIDPRPQEEKNSEWKAVLDHNPTVAFGDSPNAALIAAALDAAEDRGERRALAQENTGSGKQKEKDP